MFESTTINDALKALKSVENIERPDSDNEGDPLNSPSVYEYLSPENQDKVDHAVEVLNDYVRHPDGEPNAKSITTLNKNGYSAHLDPDQHTSNKLVGRVSVGGWEIDISDA